MPQARTLTRLASYFFYIIRINQNTLKLILALLVLVSCDSKIEKTNNATAPIIDSIQHYISNGTLENITTKVKISDLNKAYEFTLRLKNDSVKGKYLSDISTALVKANDSTLFRKINDEALSLAKQREDSTLLPSLHNDLANFLSYKVADRAYYHYAEAHKIYAAKGDKLNAGRVLISMTKIQNYIGDYTAAEITAFKALELLKPLESDLEIFECYKQLADISKLIQEYDRALEYYDKAMIYFNKLNLSELKKQSMLNNRGLVYQKMGQDNKAISFFKPIMDFDSIRYKNPRAYGRLLTNLGRSYLKLNLSTDLPDLFEQAIRVQDSIGDLGGKTSSTFELAKYYVSINDTLNAFKSLKLSKSLAGQIKHNKRMLEILSYFSKVDPENSAVYLDKYITLNNKLQNEERQLREKFARIQFETEEVSAENQLLSRQKQLWTGIAGALLLLSIATYIIVDQRRKNQKLRFEKQQQANNQEVFNLLLAQNEKVDEAKKEEQKRVSEELHDGVLGRMLGTRMMLLGLNKKTDSEAIEQRAKAIAVLQDIETEVRTISHELSHTAYQKIHNFILSIKDLISTIQTTSELQIDFNYTDNLDYDSLAGNIKIHLYRMIQESIQNAIKHANCSKIILSFETTVEFLKVSITDNGSGFNFKKEKKGIGMRNIKSRIKKINGDWNVNSKIGEGTTINLNIPINVEA